MFARSWRRTARRRARWEQCVVPDRLLAAQLYERGVSASVIENAFVLAAARRLMRPADAPPLGTIRSLAYFLPVIEEVLGMHVSPEYFQHVRRKLERIVSKRVAHLRAFGADDGTPTRTPSAWIILPARFTPTRTRLRRG